MGKNIYGLKLTYFGVLALALGIFTSIALSALGHILLFPAGITFFCIWLKRRDFEVKKSVWAILAMSFACLISIVSNLDIIENPWKNIFKLKYFIIAFLSYFSFQYLKRDFLDDKKIAWALNLFIVTATLATLSGLVASYTGFHPIKLKPACHVSRNCGFYGMYMTYGHGIAFFMVLLTGAILHRDIFKKWTPNWALYTAWAINLVGLLTSYTRGAWISTLIAIPFFFFKKNKKMFSLICAISCLALGIGFASSQKIRDTFLKRETSNSQRLAFFSSALKAVYERPFWGYGYKNYEPHSKALKERYNIPWKNQSGHAHNNFLEHLAGTGIIGLIAFLFFCFFWLKETYQKNEIIFPFVVAFLVSGMTQYTFGDGENLFFILAIFSLF